MIDKNMSNSNESSYSNQDRIYFLKLKLIEALKNKNDMEIAHYFNLLNLCEKSALVGEDQLAKFLKHKI